MKVINFVFVLCCLCVRPNFGAPKQRQPAKWQPVAATTVAPAAKSFVKPAKRSPQFNETSIALPFLPNNTEAVHELESEHGGKVYDQKHRMLLAVQSDVKVRDGVNKQEKSKNSAARNDDPEARKRLKEQLKDLLSKLHPLTDSGNESESDADRVNDMGKGVLKFQQDLTNMPKNRPHSSAHSKGLDCKDIPHSEALLNSAFMNDVSDVEGLGKRLKKPELMPAISIEDLTELRRKLLKSRLNRMKMLPPFHRYPHFNWPPFSGSAYNGFNMQNPYNCDCNYFLNPVNELGVPTIEYIWEDYDDIGEIGAELLKTDKKVGK